MNKQLEDEIVEAGISLGKQQMVVGQFMGSSYPGHLQDHKKAQAELARCENRLRSLIRQIQQPKMEDR